MIMIFRRYQLFKKKKKKDIKSRKKRKKKIACKVLQK